MALYSTSLQSNSRELVNLYRSVFFPLPICGKGLGGIESSGSRIRSRIFPGDLLPKDLKEDDAASDGGVERRDFPFHGDEDRIVAFLKDQGTDSFALAPNDQAHLHVKLHLVKILFSPCIRAHNPKPIWNSRNQE